MFRINIWVSNAKRKCTHLFCYGNTCQAHNTAIWLYWLALIYSKSQLFHELAVLQRKFLKLSVLLFPYLEHGNCNTTHLIAMRNKWIDIFKVLEALLAHNKDYTSPYRYACLFCASFSVFLSALYTHRTHTHTITNIFKNTGEAPKSGTLIFIPQKPLYTPLPLFLSSLFPRRLTYTNTTR